MKLTSLFGALSVAAVASAASIQEGGARFRRVQDATGKYAIRFKEPEGAGLDTVQQYSGYLDIDDDKHFFFWFFESRNDPVNDPVMMWLSGGPGCSSLGGMLLENGPSYIDKNLKPVYNHYSWNKNASMLYLDQPLNTGLSYSNSTSVNMTEPAAKDVYEFLQLFFKQFDKYAENDFHIVGESYAGHTIPAVGVELIENNDSIVNFKSIAMGNPVVDFRWQAESYYEYLVWSGAVSWDDCEKAKGKKSTCHDYLLACEQSGYDKSPCMAAINTCNSLGDPFFDTGKNPYDIRKQCVGGSLCYENENYMVDYMNQKKVLDAIGSQVDKFEDCSDKVGNDFSNTIDFILPFSGNVSSLLAHDIPVLVYAGDQDFICNWLGQREWMNQMKWDHKDDYNSAKLHEFTVTGGEPVGTIQSSNNLTLARIYQAGHLVPMDRPVVALDLINRWVSGDYALEN